VQACVMRNHQLVVDEVPEPRPALGQVLVRNLACGICGSDLHFLKHAETMVAMTEELVPSMGPFAAVAGLNIDLSRDIIMGHELCGEVLESGPDTAGPKSGARVVSMPVVFSADGVHQLAYNNDFPGGYSERMLLAAPLVLEVPNGLDTSVAALTEPLAVGMHAVAKSGISAGDAALVVGCGPVGLAVVAALRMRDVEVVVCSDPSPIRRRVATAMGATEVVDPEREPIVEAWRRVDGQRPVVAFEAVGVPGMITHLLRDVPVGTRLVVVGVCLEQDTIHPFFGIAKELNVQFALAYTSEDFADALRALSEGEVDVGPMITGSVDLEGVPGAFETLSNPGEHVKILVEPTPSRSGDKFVDRGPSL
jgi:threonine dehydrogenase-like Zn-dependent dehydrogenase